MINNEELLKKLEKQLTSFSKDTTTTNIGLVEKNNDGVISASGLSQGQMGELVEFEHGEKGVIFNLGEDHVSIILLDQGTKITEGDTIKRTETLLSLKVSEELLGRVVNPLGVPLDGKPRITKGKDMPLERIAAGVVEREPVDTPLKTGIKAIDSMIPIGRGQRELIIGDRGLGKTAIIADTIINQRKFAANKNTKEKDKKPVICIYVAIGQKQSTVAQIVDKFKQEKAIDYTIVVAASAADPVSLQYLAPYAGAAISEYFLEKGLDVLVAYDDLTKHAWAYRQISLVLRRPAGREAYPGDIFYLHSKLLERAVKLNKKNGGGSITALPVIETQAGDISAYIPTNVISITDGQIYLQSDLFNVGIRPAVNVGLSVSRVGGAAQTSGMKSVSGTLRLELAQFRSLEAFAQFGSELDPETLKQLERGKRIIEVLKQPQYQPLDEPFQILSIWMITSGQTDDIPLDQIRDFEEKLHTYIADHKPKVIEILATGEKVNQETSKLLEKTVQEFKKMYAKNN